MLRKILSLFVCTCCFALFVYAQNECVIEGNFSNTKLCYNNKNIETVYLNELDEMENLVLVDSAKVVDGQFRFRLKLTDYIGAQIYIITGFDNGNSPFFVEPGNVKLNIDAAYPVRVKASGTSTNELYEAYKQIGDECTRIQIDSLAMFRQTRPSGWLDSEEGVKARTRIGGEAKLKTHLSRLRFLLLHSDSPLSPLMMRKELGHVLSISTADQLRRSTHPLLEAHPYSEAFSNAVLARNIQVGAELPNIHMMTDVGQPLTLKDFRGKYVLLDFWASWCGPCRREIPYVIQLYQETRPLQDKFVIISFSLDNKQKNWLDAIPTMGMNLPNWVHGSDLQGWNSPAARSLGVTAIPKTFLLDPEGRLIAIDLRGEHMIQKVKELLQP